MKVFGYAVMLLACSDFPRTVDGVAFPVQRQGKSVTPLEMDSADVTQAMLEDPYLHFVDESGNEWLGNGDSGASDETEGLEPLPDTPDADSGDSGASDEAVAPKAEKPATRGKAGK